MGINRAGGAGPPRCFALVIRAAAKGEPRAILDRILRAGASPCTGQAGRSADGRKLQVLAGSPAGSLAWWAEGDDLVVSLVSPSGPDAIIAALEGREPNAVEHPNRVALIRGDDAPGFVPVGLAFFDMAALPSLPSEAVGLGLDGIKRFDYRWGFQDQALESIVGVVVPSPRRGIPALFDQPVFDARDLPPLPGGLAGFTVLSLDPARFWDVLSTAMKAQARSPAARSWSGRIKSSRPFCRRPGCGCARISWSTSGPDSRSTTFPPRSTLRRTFWRDLHRASFAFPRWRS